MRVVHYRAHESAIEAGLRGDTLPVRYVASAGANQVGAGNLFSSLCF